ncbi:MAG: MAPEG family protein [Paracoccaceae bacterium]
MPEITPIYIALIALFFLWLSGRVIAVRRSHSISLGDGGDKVLERRIRAQGNCAEYAPIGLLLLLALELQGAQVWVLHVLGLMLLAGRVLHGLALNHRKPAPMMRISGMLLTLGMIAVAAILSLGMAVT